MNATTATELYCQRCAAITGHAVTITSQQVWATCGGCALDVDITDAIGNSARLAELRRAPAPEAVFAGLALQLQDTIVRELEPTDDYEMGGDPLHEDPAYLAYLAEQERQCGAEYVTGGHDPYSTACDLDRDHELPHEGDDPMGGDGRISWEGGTVIAGDRTPYRNVKWDTGAAAGPSSSRCVVYGDAVPTDHVGVPLTVGGARCCDRTGR